MMNKRRRGLMLSSNSLQRLKEINLFANSYCKAKELFIALSNIGEIFLLKYSHENFIDKPI